MRLILASASPRRQELVRLLGLEWEVRTAEVDEASIDHPEPPLNVIDTAWLKASAVARSAPDDALIVSADTTVALGSTMLNKPAGEHEARIMLQKLRGRTHQVHTGIVVIDRAGGRAVRDVASVDVPMREYSESEINTYVASGDPLDKAGGYAIQNAFFRPVLSLDGCYAAVVGLPLCHLARALKALGVPPEADVAADCQAYHQYNCPVFQDILTASPPVTRWPA
jgi:septum formation protein